MKIATFLLFGAAVIAAQAAKAQTAVTSPKPADRAKIEGIAQKDGRKFKLSDADLKKFKAEHFRGTSDYFKPTAAAASNPALLKDSTYVKIFRFEAYTKALGMKQSSS